MAFKISKSQSKIIQNTEFCFMDKKYIKKKSISKIVKIKIYLKKFHHLAKYVKKSHRIFMN
jgi:hypothetical protein